MTRARDSRCHACVEGCRKGASSTWITPELSTSNVHSMLIAPELLRSSLSPFIALPYSDDASMRPIWKGALSFGLVNIPVQLHSAVRAGEKVSFRLLHR